MADAGRRTAALALTGLMLAGYGALVLVGVLPHDAPAAGLLSLLLGLVVLTLGVGMPHLGHPAARMGDGAARGWPSARARFVAGLGAACTGCTVGYALARRSGLGGPEVALVLYGVALMASSLALERTVGRRRRVAVSTLVGWSFALVLAPLALFALNGLVSEPGAGNVAAPVLEPFVVAPTAQALRWSGVPATQVGSTMLVPTERGSLSLDVGLVCAGLYPAVLFGGLVAVQGWTERMRPGRLAAVLGAGLAGLWAMNVVRMVALTRIGMAWGVEALQTAHSHLGWILFAAFMAVFWRLVPRGRREGPVAAG